MRVARWALTIAIAVGVAGCAPTLGDRCDEAAAHRVVYRRNGLPAYIGQAMMLQSCSAGGGVCHSSAARDRIGAPFGLDFDVVPVPVGDWVTEEIAREYRDRLSRHQIYILAHRDEIWASVADGSMPPGDIGEELAVPQFYDDPNEPGTRIPDIHDDDGGGREILRNWLVCGAPVIEYVDEPMFVPHCRTDDDCVYTGACEGTRCRGIGDLETSVPITYVPSDFGSIYEAILAPNCASLPLCHGADTRAGGLDLSSMAAAARALAEPAQDESAPHLSDAERPCLEARASTPERVVPRNLGISYVYQKLTGTAACGSSMPIGASLSNAEIAAIEDWIMMGAPGLTPTP